MRGYDPDKHHRRSIRLREYDYTQPGAYFVTIDTHDGELLFDDPVLRRVAETMWQRIPRHFPFVQLDESIVMPNHLHGILFLADRAREGDECPEAGSEGGADLEDNGDGAHPPPAEDAPPRYPPSGPLSGSLGAIVGNFKSVTARRINRIRKTPGHPVWQRNYYERVIRNERELIAIRKYIRDNPENWEE
jgi:putative transposase